MPTGLRLIDKDPAVSCFGQVHGKVFLVTVAVVIIKVIQRDSRFADLLPIVTITGYDFISDVQSILPDGETYSMLQTLVALI